MENFTLSLDYYNNIKNICNNFLNYIKEYKIVSKQYYQKLLSLNKQNKIKIKEIIKETKAKNNIDFSNFYNFIECIFKIQDIYIENLGFFIYEIENGIQVFNNINSEQIIPICETKFEESKKELFKKETDIKKFKNEFFENMINIEKLIYNYYYINNNENKENKNKENIKNKKNNNDDKEDINLLNEEELDNNINNLKKMEDLYKEQIEEGKKLENNFIKVSKFCTENVKNITNQIFEKIKHLTLNYLMSLKNNFKLPLTEIDSLLPDLINIDKSLKINELMEKKFHKDDNYRELFIPEKYCLKVFEKNNNNFNKDNKDNKNINKDCFDKIIKKIIEVEDGYERTLFVEDENTLLTMKKINKNFELIDLKNINLEIEEEKMKINKLSLKLVSNIKREKDFNENTKEIFNMTGEEINLIEKLLNKHHNRIIFMHILNKFRSLGKYIMQDKLFLTMIKFFNLILDKVIEDDDIFSGKNIIILSQTYYYKDKNKKIYLQKEIMNHKIFKNNKFWENLFNFEMNKEIQKITKIEMKDNIYNKMSIDEIRKRDRNKYAKMAFGQIMTLASNMIDFGIKPEDAYKLVEPKIIYYQVDKDFIYSIKCVLGINEENDNIKNDINEEDKKNNINKDKKQINNINENGKNNNNGENDKKINIMDNNVIDNNKIKNEINNDKENNKNNIVNNKDIIFEEEKK